MQYAVLWRARCTYSEALVVPLGPVKAASLSAFDTGLPVCSKFLVGRMTECALGQKTVLPGTARAAL